MLELFENNELKPKNIILASLMLVITSYLVMVPEALGTVSALFSWTYLSIGGIVSLLLLIGYDKSKLFFKRMNKGSLKWILLAVLLGFVVSVVFVLIGNFFHISVAENSGLSDVGTTSTPLWLNVAVTLTTFFSLMGEEIVTAAIMVIIFYYVRQRVDSVHAWVISAILSAILFGLMHYTVYDGNVFQCIFVIGIGRLPFTYAWRKTGSLWGGIWAHVLYDVIVIGIIYLSV